jgi:hypothetical protein
MSERMKIKDKYETEEDYKEIEIENQQHYLQPVL